MANDDFESMYSIEFDSAPGHMREAGEIEHFLGAFGRTPNGGLIVTTSGQAYIHRDLIFTLVARLKLPAMYYERSFVTAGGPDVIWV
jgi:putative ABC transport system substrate-binding protein